MRSKKWKDKIPKVGKSSDSGYYAARDECDRLDSLSKERYAPEEKSTVRKVMIPGSLLKKLWKRIFR